MKRGFLTFWNILKRIGFLRIASGMREPLAPGLPATNNGVEATNAVIKKQYTLKERLPVGQFLHTVADILRNWSESRSPANINCKHFATVPTISLSEWTRAYQWAIKLCCKMIVVLTLLHHCQTQYLSPFVPFANSKKKQGSGAHLMLLKPIRWQYRCSPSMKIMRNSLIVHARTSRKNTFVNMFWECVFVFVLLKFPQKLNHCPWAKRGRGADPKKRNELLFVNSCHC